MTFDRRAFLGLGSLGAAGALTALWGGGSPAAAASFEFNLCDAEWRKRLTPAQYATLRHAVTERPESSPLDREHHKGIYHCAGCGLPLYSSATKFDSGTGWPSFWKPLPNAVRTKSDHELLMERTEILCRRCGGHLGHVFDD